MRHLIAISALAALAGCYSDNASPFVHGAKNAPSNFGSTKVAKSGPPTDTTGTGGYAASSGFAGGINRTIGPKVAAPEVQVQTAQTATAAPQTPAPAASTQQAPPQPLR